MTCTGKKTDFGGVAPPGASTPAPQRRRRKTLRVEFRDGLKAAMTADPEDLQSTKPRTMMTLMVRELVKQAGSGRSVAVKTVMGFIRDGESEGAEDASALSQGIFDDDRRAEPRFEWSDGAWDASEREAPAPKAETGPVQSKEERTAQIDRIIERCVRAAEADRLNAERRIRLEYEREGWQIAKGGTPVSGNSGQNAPHVEAGSARIAGKVVDG